MDDRSRDASSCRAIHLHKSTDAFKGLVSWMCWIASVWQWLKVAKEERLSQRDSNENSFSFEIYKKKRFSCTRKSIRSLARLRMVNCLRKAAWLYFILLPISLKLNIRQKPYKLKVLTKLVECQLSDYNRLLIVIRLNLTHVHVKQTLRCKCWQLLLLILIFTKANRAIC